MRLKYLISFLFIGVLLGSYFLLPYDQCWGKIDKSFFMAFNYTLSWGKSYQLFWATLNHKYHDWLIDLVYLIMILAYILKTHKKTKTHRIIESLTIISIIVLVIAFINKYLFRYYLIVEATSPSLKYTNYLNLNKLIPFIKTKIYATSTFPGDHATTALLFFLLTLSIFSRKTKIFLFFYTLILLCPRLITGAHNLSDICIGSLSIAVITSLIHRYCLYLSYNTNSLNKTSLLK